MARVASEQRELTDDEKNLIVEAMDHCERIDKQPNHYNVTYLIRCHYPGRGGKLSAKHIKQAVELVKEKQQHDEIRTTEPTG